MISMTGIKLINNSKMNYRNTSIVGLAIALGMGVTQANAALAQLPAWVTTIFGKSPVALSTLVAVFLESGFTKGERRVNEDPDKRSRGSCHGNCGRAVGKRTSDPDDGCCHPTHRQT